LNTKIKISLAAAIRYLIYKHITFLRHKVFRALPNATVFIIVLVIITLKTILNEKVAYHFCQVILLFSKMKMNLCSIWPFAQISDYFYYLDIWQCARYFVIALFKELALITIREM